MDQKGSIVDKSVIKRLATQRGIYNGDKEGRFEQIEAFANAIAAHEREECAKACDRQAVAGASVCADAIRSRGNK